MTAGGIGMRVDLSGVPETMLWPLWNRASEMRRSRRRRLIEDPMAADLVRRIDYPFRRHFGPPNVLHVVRARFCDDLIRNYVARSEQAPVVVALGEGLETQLWRLGDTPVRWISVDVPEAIQVRRRLLPADERQSLVGCSALDPVWMDRIPDGAAPFVSAAGLLMYFKEAEVCGLLSRIGSRFPRAELFFDTITPLVAKRTLKGFNVTRDYTAPPMPWGISMDDIPGFIKSISNLELIRNQTYADPFPFRTPVYKLLSQIPPIRRNLAGGLVHARAANNGLSARQRGSGRAAPPSENYHERDICAIETHLQFEYDESSLYQRGSR